MPRSRTQVVGGQSAEYLWGIEGGPGDALFHEGDDFFFDGWEPKGIEALEHALGHLPPLSIQIQVSGRIDGNPGEYDASR